MLNPLKCSYVGFYNVVLNDSKCFQSEFSYIGEIGKGGFGEVIKVKNNLDSQV